MVERVAPSTSAIAAGMPVAASRALLACAVAVTVAVMGLAPGLPDTAQRAGSETLETLQVQASEASRGEKAAVGSQKGAAPALLAAGAAGDGLRAIYYNREGFVSPKVDRVDPAVDFAWGKGAPAPGMGADGFSVRWSGFVEVPTDGSWRFYTRGNDGMRLWIDGEKVVDSWKVRDANTAVEASSAALNLESDVRHQVRVDFFERRGGATARLLWGGPGVTKSVVPASRLYTRDADVAEPPPVPAGYERWSDAATWSSLGYSGKPADGAVVTIPAGKKVLLDESTASLGGVVVEGELRLAETDLDLRSEYVMVHPGGLFAAGSAEDPFDAGSRATITLTGNDPAKNVMGMGTKFLGTMEGGRMVMHGADKTPWTRLSATAAKGAYRIRVEDATGWREGDKIAIASTDFHWNHTERRQIAEIRYLTPPAGSSARPAEIIVDGAALAYSHFGVDQAVAGRIVSERAEVSNLDRNLEVRGDAGSAESAFGAHTMAMKGSSAEIEDVEFYRSGQRMKLGRYPFHTHVMGDSGADVTVRDSAVNGSYSRCMTVHGTNFATLERNVCDDAVGHGFFMEDGIERDNVIKNNLVTGLRQPAEGQALLEHETSNIGGFWITNPDNVVEGNVAAGVEGVGIWYALPEQPLGLSKQAGIDQSVFPQRTPLKSMANNTVHSNDGDGFRLDEQQLADGTLAGVHYNPRTDPADRDSAAVPATFEGLKAWKNRYHGAWMRGSNITLKDAVLSDNQTGAAFPGNEAFLDNAFAVGETANTGNAESWETKRPGGAELPTPWEPGATITGFDFYDGRVGVKGGLFANFASDAQRPAGALGRVDDNRFPFHNGNFVRGLSFVPGTDRLYFETPKVDRDGDHSLVVRDEDGTLTGTTGAVVTTKEPFLTTDACRLREAWNAYSCGDNPDKPGVAAAPYASFLAEITMGSDLSSFKPLHVRRGDGVAQRLVGTYPDADSAHTNLVANRDYATEFNGGAAALPKETMYVLHNSQGRTLTVNVPVPNNSFRVERYGSIRQPASSMDALRAMTSSGYYYDSAAKVVTLRLVAGTNTWEELRIERTDI